MTDWNRIDRQQKKRSGVRCRMPRANRICGFSVLDENRVYGRAKESLDERCRRSIGADEIAQWTDDTFAELRPVPEEFRGSRGETNTLSLQSL